jgi:hypothetical protein
MNWDALGSIADAVNALVAAGALYLAYRIYKKSPQIAERLGQTIDDQRKLGEAVALLDKEQGNRDVIVEHRVDAFNVLRNRATIDREGRILKLYTGWNGKWQVGDKLQPGDYRELDEFPS